MVNENYWIEDFTGIQGIWLGSGNQRGAAALGPRGLFEYPACAFCAWLQEQTHRAQAQMPERKHDQTGN